MTEREPTEEETAVFDYAFSNYYGVGNDIHYLYHYRSGEIVKDIIRDNGVQLRLTYVNNFPDKYEGKTIEVYYDMALEELLHEGEIDVEQYDSLSKVVVYDKEEFVSRGNDGITYGKSKEYDAFILCFSTKKDDTHMFGEYGKHKGGKFCLGFFCSKLKHLSSQEYGNSIVISVIQVLYGRQIVEYLKTKILEVINNKYYYDNAGILLEDTLHMLQYAAKLSKFQKDNEVRLVVCLPKNEKGSSKYFERYREDDDKEYLRLSLPKHALCEITADPRNTVEETARIRDILNALNYGLEL